FSSRRRHTRSTRDWSSDVCSSDLGHGCGLALGFEKGSYLAACAEVSIEAGRIKIIRVTEAFECGAVVNPDQLRNQVEGSVIMARSEERRVGKEWRSRRRRCH